MVKATQAYISTTGAIFQTKEEAEMDEIREAADLLAGVTRDALVNIVRGKASSPAMRDAILRLAEAITPAPVATPVHANHGAGR